MEKQPIYWPLFEQTGRVVNTGPVKVRSSSEVNNGNYPGEPLLCLLTNSRSFDTNTCFN